MYQSIGSFGEVPVYIYLSTHKLGIGDFIDDQVSYVWQTKGKEPHTMVQV